MPRAAYCDACDTNVYVTFDGRCPNGHDAEHLSGYYEAPATVSPPVRAVAYRARAGIPRWVWLAVACLLFLFILSFGAMAIPAIRETRELSAQARCFTNQADIESAVASYTESAGTLPAGLDDLTPGLLPQRPSCPAGGTYLVDPAISWVSCTLHGYYGDYIVPVASPSGGT